MHAARNNQKVVLEADLDYAVERVVGGTEKRSHAISPEERKIVAYHEAGHALIGWLLPTTDALLKVTIVPRTNAALGFAQYTPTERYLLSKQAVCFNFNSKTFMKYDILENIFYTFYLKIFNLSFYNKIK